MNKINVALALIAPEPQVTGVERECPGKTKNKRLKK